MLDLEIKPQGVTVYAQLSLAEAPCRHRDQPHRLPERLRPIHDENTALSARSLQEARYIVDGRRRLPTRCIPKDLI